MCPYLGRWALPYTEQNLEGFRVQNTSKVYAGKAIGYVISHSVVKLKALVSLNYLSSTSLKLRTCIEEQCFFGQIYDVAM
jgi:hypothetical protein